MPNNIGYRLRQLREQMVPVPNQETVGRLIHEDGQNATPGQAQSIMKRIENGEREPTISEAMTLADYFGVDFLWLVIGGDNKENTEKGGCEKDSLVPQKIRDIFASDDQQLKQLVQEAIATCELKLQLKRQQERENKILNQPSTTTETVNPQNQYDDPPGIDGVLEEPIKKVL